MAKIWVTTKRKFHYDEFFVSKQYPKLAKLSDGHFVQIYRHERIRLGVESILDPLREKVKKPVAITSGHRSPELNLKVGGSDTSDHLVTCAVDITVEGLTSYQLAIFILTLGVPYRQIVAYKRKPHVHVSWNIPGRPYKKEVVFK